MCPCGGSTTPLFEAAESPAVLTLRFAAQQPTHHQVFYPDIARVRARWERSGEGEGHELRDAARMYDTSYRAPSYSALRTNTVYV